MRGRAWMIGIVMLGVAGCVPVPSLHPLVEGDGIEVPGIVGTWTGSSEPIRFERGESGAYTMSAPESEVPADRFAVKFTRIGGRLFADLSLAQRTLPGGDRHPFLLATHVVCRVGLEGDTLRLGAIDDDWLVESVRRGRVRARFERTSEGIVLTETTAGLARLLEKAAADDAAFSAAVVLARRR